MGRKTIKVDEAVAEQHNERRQELGLTWDGYMARLEFVDGERDTDPEEIAEYLADRFEPIKNTASMANDPTVDADAQQIINRLDDLEAELPRKVAEELR